MDQKGLLKIQTERGAKAQSSDSESRTLDSVIEECRKVIKDKSDQYRELNYIDKKEAIKNIIVGFVMQTTPLVEGYIDGENRPDTLKLVNKLVESITDYGILTQAMNDESIFEIRANGKEIKVEINGHVDDLRDEEGNIVSFDSPEQQEIILHKMLGDVRLTPKDALVSASTLEGFRIAAVHSSAMSPDPENPTSNKYHSFVLRKFKKQKMSISDIVKKHTMSDNMGRFLNVLTLGGLTFFTVGPTASGKTTTNNAILMGISPDIRTVVIQNPSEIDVRLKNHLGRVYNDVIHLEAREIDNPRPTDPTMRNLMNITLRLSPVFICLGEIRDNIEFKEAMKIMQAGHSLNTTFHAESSQGAITRFLTAYLAESGNEPSHLALINITSLVNIVIVQKIMRDGKRRIIQISEVVGVDPEDSEKPLINDLYRFEITGEPEYDASGNIKKINGKHVRVGTLSQRTIRKLELEGVSRKRYDFLVNPVGKGEVETYTGENIDRYGLEARLES